MAEKDALADFDFNKVSGPSLWLKFEAGRPLTLRILTTDPVVAESEFIDKASNEVSLRTQFAFVVYNFTDNQAQIMRASPSVARKIGDIHRDADFGANIRKIDIKISPSGEGLERRYDIQVLPNARTLTPEQVKEAQAIQLDEKVQGYRMSEFDTIQKKKNTDPEPEQYSAALQEKFGNEEPVNLDDIPF